MSGRCLVCGEYPADRAHLRSRGAGAKWEEHEFIYMCRRHHVEQHTSGWPRFLDKYPSLQMSLEARGWALVDKGNGFRKLIWQGKNE